MKFPPFTRVLPICIISAVLLAGMVGFVVRENERAVITRFGKPVKVIANPGFYGKWPWPIETVNRVDSRLSFYELRLSEALTKDRRNVIVPVFVAWKVDDPLKFLEAIGNFDNARSKLDSLISSAKNTVLGTCEFKQLVSAVDHSDVKLAEIE